MKELIEKLKGLQQNDAGQFELSEDLIVELVKEMTKADRTIDGQKFELSIMTAAQERMEEGIREQFDAMQIALIAFVMFKCKRKTLLIDSREIQAEAFQSIQPRAVCLDGFRTSYTLEKAKQP